jgi:hypothetical protein
MPIPSCEKATNIHLDRVMVQIKRLAQQVTSNPAIRYAWTGAIE